MLTLFSMVMSLSGLISLCLYDPPFESINYGFMILVGLARVGTAGLFTTVWIAHPTFFPTLFTATSLGICSQFGMAVEIFAP